MRALFAALMLLFPMLALAGPNTVAVLYFDNQGNEELEPLKVGLADMMISDLHGSDAYTVIERSRLQAILDELELGHSEVVDPATAAKVGKLLGAEWYITGSYSEILGSLQISARMFKIETSEIVQADTVMDKPREFVAMEQQLAAQMKAALLRETAASAGAAEPAPTTAPAPTPAAPEPTGTRSTPTDTTPPTTATADIVTQDPDTLAAAVSFSEGLIYLDQKDVARARDSFATAVAQDPGLDAAKSQLASLDL
ncbi:MAG: hypothetical protein KC912_06180 [Proteobacteria bacterium]|nr:hypothetical protein [Pseudomonadota bacterium]